MIRYLILAFTLSAGPFIEDGSVTTPKLAAGAVTTAKLHALSVDNTILAAGSALANLANGSIPDVKLVSTFAKGPGSAVSSNIPVFSGTSGALLSDSGVSIVNVPTSGEALALAGTSGTPGSGNKYVTDADSRLSDSRAPTGAAGGSLSGAYPSPAVATNANLTGPVTSVGNATSIANGAISNAMLANGAVANLSGTNTGDQTITLTGDCTGMGAGSFATSCTKTGGVAFAASATTDTTSATNVTSGTLTLANPLAGNGQQINNIANPTVQTDAATKQYVDRVAHYVNAVTSGGLAATYSNGASGVGATLTSSSNVAFPSQDSFVSAVGARYLIKNQASTFQNGIYTLTTLGTGSVPWVLTRVTDYDEAAEMGIGETVNVVAGSISRYQVYVQSVLAPFTVGTTAPLFANFQASAGSGASVTTFAGTQTIASLLSATTFGSTPNANGLTATAGASGAANTIALQPADATHPGAIIGTSSAQTLAPTLTFSNGNTYAAATITAAANDLQSGCTALTKEVNIVNSSTSTTNSVCLPVATAIGKHVFVSNATANVIHVFPATSGAIGGGATNAEWATTLVAQATTVTAAVDCYAQSSTVWACSGLK